MLKIDEREDVFEARKQLDVEVVRFQGFWSGNGRELRICERSGQKGKIKGYRLLMRPREFCTCE